MVNRDLLAVKLAELAGRVERARRHCPPSPEAPPPRRRSVAAGLRNLVAHGYGGVDAAVVHTAATRGCADLEAFAREVAAWAASAPPRLREE